MRTRRTLSLAAAAGAALAVALPGAALARHAHDLTGATATGAPGSESYFDLARKDCVGTARDTTSKVWFTVADGALSDVYWPTVDATNVHSLQYLVTDGHSFTDLQTRDMRYRLIPDPTGMSCTVIATPTASTRDYSITTTYIADPARDAVLMRVRFHGPIADRLYVRLDPLAGGTGGGGSQNAGANTAVLAGTSTHPIPIAENTNTQTDATNRDYAVPTFEALQSRHGFTAASVGYAGTASDGEQMLDAAHALTTYTSAPDGHVALTAELPTTRTDTLALGFGQTEATALATAGAAATTSFGRAFAQYERGWLRYDAGLRRPSRRLGAAAVDEYYRSVNVVKASEDKTFPGAIAAGLASPWGQAVPAGNFASDGLPTYFGSYREVFARDLYEAFTGLLVAGDIQTARDATRFLFDRQQQPDGSMPRNSLENGKPAPDTGGLQLDETAYPILMAWQSGLAGDADLYTQHIVPAADFLVAHGPSDGVERWEEQSGYSPSTIAAEIAGLTAASHIAAQQGDSARAAVYQATADDFARNIKSWDVTTNGPFTSGTDGLSVPSYFLRLSKNGDPNSADPYSLNNGLSTPVDQRSVIDAGFLDLVRLGVLPASDPDVVNSLKVVDTIIGRSTPSGPGFYRYGTTPAGPSPADTNSMDGYGDCYVPPSGAAPSGCAPSGAPWPPTGNGTGHLWPVLSGERGEYEVAAADFGFARGLLASMQNMQSGQGLEPEQAWEDPNVPATSDPVDPADPATDSIGFVDGQAAGSASPLTWAQAQFARLALDLSAGRDLETPAIVSQRYVAHGMPGALPLAITSPTAGASISSSPVTVTGTSAPGATIDGESLSALGGSAASSTTANSSGNWTLSLPTGFGSTTVTVTATRGDATGYTQEVVTDVALPGTQLLDVTDPSHDDNGPGSYAYPTAGAFTPGAFDLTELKVARDANNTYIQVTLRDLTPTFGNTFGAQLLDVYVHDPNAATTSTQPASSALNYTIDKGFAWSERLEAQGFAAPQWISASGATVGSAQFVADSPSRTATLVVPNAQFGQVGPGWAFTVTLTGQDGFSPGQARQFTATPGGYTFGVCAAGNPAAFCSTDPTTVPKVMDTFAPSDQGSGATQAQELSPPYPPALQGVTIP
jgi:glucoamylase